MKIICTLTVFCAICGTIAAMFLIEVPRAWCLPGIRDWFTLKENTVMLGTFLYDDFIFPLSALCVAGYATYGLWRASSAICGWLRKERV